jgi:signal peptidase I
MTQWLKNNRSVLIILLFFGLFRTALADWNPIPSESMHPTLLDGDVVLVNRVAYDLKLPLTDISLARLGEPRHGDVVTFHSPSDGTRLIKRLVGLPGDVVELRDDRLYINGSVAQYGQLRSYREPRDYAGSTLAVKSAETIDGSRREIQFLPELEARRNFGPVVVPADSYFFLGDNRDDSGDSRYFGFVPRRLLIGRAHHVLVSADFKGNWKPRFERFGTRIL